MPQDLIDDKSTLVQVMAWCREATTIARTSVDQYLQRHMASLGPNELSISPVLATHLLRESTPRSSILQILPIERDIFLAIKVALKL